MQNRILKFNDASLSPSIHRGSCKAFLVDVTRAHNGKSYTFPALYLNQYPLWFEYENEERECTGWYSIETGPPDDSQYHKLDMKEGDVMNGWAEIPQQTGTS